MTKLININSEDMEQEEVPAPCIKIAYELGGATFTGSGGSGMSFERVKSDILSAFPAAQNIRQAGEYLPGEETEPTPEEIKQARIAEIDTQIAALERKQGRPIREIELGVEVEANKARLNSLNEQIEALRAERATL